MQRITMATLIALTCAGADQAQAGVSPPVLAGAYYEQNGTQGCGSFGSSSGESSSGSAGTFVSTCQLLFPAPPAGKQLFLDSVACQIKYPFGTNVALLRTVYLVQNVNGALARKHILDADLDAQDDEGLSYYTVESYLDGSYLVTAPVRVVTEVSEPSVISMDCQITGTLRSPP